MIYLNAVLEIILIDSESRKRAIKCSACDLSYSARDYKLLFDSKKLLYFNENFDQINLSVDNFSKHLQDLYELPAFYGDENLEKLLEHSRELRRDLEDFKDRYSQ